MNILDKEEFRIKLEEINRLVEKKNYKDAMEVVDSIDWRRVKNVHTLCVVGEIYAANKRYDDSREIFLLAYHRASIGRNILYRLIEVSLKMKDIDEAMEYYDEFLEVAPNDSTQYVLKYKIRKAEQAPLEEQIRILEDYKEKEFTERWSYELAKLYYQNGDTKKCLDLCDEMVLWFSDGKYVMKALDLKSRMGMLSGKEKEKYDKQFIPNLKTVEDSAENKEEVQDGETKEPQAEAAPTADDDAPVIDSVDIDERDVNGAESLQEKISKGIRDIFTGKKKESEEEFMKEEEEAPAEEVPEEMIKDISSEAEPTNVPELEPEDAVIPPPATPGTSIFSTIEEKIEEVTNQEIKDDQEETPEEVTEEVSEEELPEVVIVGIRFCRGHGTDQIRFAFFAEQCHEMSLALHGVREEMDAARKARITVAPFWNARRETFIRRKFDQFHIRTVFEKPGNNALILIWRKGTGRIKKLSARTEHVSCLKNQFSLDRGKFL